MNTILNDSEKSFSAGWNMPGYLPEMEPQYFDQFEEAKAFIYHELNELECPSEDLQLIFDAAEPFCLQFGDYVYWVDDLS
mgnify:CR=1 FL=1